MSIRQVDPEKIMAVLRYLQQNFSNHTLKTFPDPDNPNQQGYRIGWKGDGKIAHEFAVHVEFFHKTDIPNIATKLTAYQLAYALHSTNSEKILVTEHGIQRQ
jgi:hypothetical protein